jgi:hypothetical protein
VVVVSGERDGVWRWDRVHFMSECLFADNLVRETKGAGLAGAGLLGFPGLGLERLEDSSRRRRRRRDHVISSIRDFLFYYFLVRGALLP